MNPLTIIGGGLAGCEAAWQAAKRGIPVKLYEMRPTVQTGAHTTSKLAELICSNSLGSQLIDRASGLLKEELRQMGSLLLECAEEYAVPAGSALAPDRDAFSDKVTQRIEGHPQIEVIRQEVTEVPQGPTIIASGPLTSPRFSEILKQLTDEDHLYFFDAIAPIVNAESIDMTVAFRASRYQKETNDNVGDYINCPLSADEYQIFIEALLEAEGHPLRSFEQDIPRGVRAGSNKFFEGCLPIEIMASRGREALAFGPMRPVGLINPRTRKRPYAVLQLRQDNLAGDLYNLVGFQTNLRYPEQERVFRLIPGLQNADFVRFGQMHRNTFINSPNLLLPTLQFKKRKGLFFAGQITGVEGYIGNIATGVLAGWNTARLMQDQEPLTLPQTTMLGALCHYITHARESDFQPMKANFGILPTVEKERKLAKQQRIEAYVARSQEDLKTFLSRIERSW